MAISSERLARAKQADELMRNQGLTQLEVAEQLGMTVGEVAGCLRDWRQKTQHSETPTTKKLLQFPSLPSPQVVTRPENENTDTKAWESQRDALLKKHEYVRVMHMNDLHLPYYDSAALALWLEIAGRFQPQIVIVGSDMFDLPTLSRFEPDPDISVDDWQERSREYYWPVVNQLNRLLPNAILVWIYGNHERRAIKAIKASDSPKIGMSYFLDTVRCGNRVLYVGKTEHVKIGDLVVAHGNKANKYAAATMGLQWPDKIVNFGHIHRYQSIGNAFANGMLCQLIPHYDDNGYPVTQEQGTSTMTVYSAGGVLRPYHNFVQTKSGLFTQYGNEIISVARAETQSSAA